MSDQPPPPPRQLEILRRIADGHNDQAIADQLYLSHSTVKSHKERLFRRLGVHTAAHAVAVGYRRGLLAVDQADIEDLAILRQARGMGYQLALVPRDRT